MESYTPPATSTKHVVARRVLENNQESARAFRAAVRDKDITFFKQNDVSNLTNVTVPFINLNVLFSCFYQRFSDEDLVFLLSQLTSTEKQSLITCEFHPLNLSQQSGNLIDVLTYNFISNEKIFPKLAIVFNDPDLGTVLKLPLIEQYLEKIQTSILNQCKPNPVVTLYSEYLSDPVKESELTDAQKADINRQVRNLVMERKKRLAELREIETKLKKGMDILTQLSHQRLCLGVATTTKTSPMYVLSEDIVIMVASCLSNLKPSNLF